jgi:sugar/nucleoside kinase (ribokinase family)
LDAGQAAQLGRPVSGVFLTPRLRQSYGRLIDEVAALGYEIALDTGWPSGDWNDALREELFDWASRCDHVLLNEIEVQISPDKRTLAPRYSTSARDSSRARVSS